MLKDTKFLDGLRGLAAIYVLIHHARWLLTESYSLRIDKTFIGKFLTYTLSMFRFGHEVVIFFFVLSGFVIHLSVLKAKEKALPFQIKKYFNKRINRIYPAFIFALLLTLILDYLGKNVFHLEVYTKGSKYFQLFLTETNFSVTAFFTNIINIQGLTSSTPVFGTNAALWSLSYEWWFYMFYPLFYTMRNRSISLTLALQIVLFLTVNYLIRVDFPIISALFSKMLIWWLGTILAEIYFQNIKLNLRYLSTLILAIPLAVLFFFNDRIIGDLLWGIGFIGLLGYLLSIKNTNLFIKILSSLKGTASFSYTLYLIHVPIIYMAHAYLIKKYNGVLPTTYFWVFILSSILIVVSSLLARRLENLVLIKIKKTT